ncbi:hypothetical protein [Variovorax sp. dw_954]|uniref:hypothetical protein n=1 Tax=Variovorax sp. dw_954 TaxID=2720078 RepID=UPI001BD293A4|nr:hypothetical protein [Variovorax sp. dw_954]
MLEIVSKAERVMQPVVELRKFASTYTYGVRAPRAHGVVPPVSYVDEGFATLADCLLDVARGLGGNFPRIYVRLEGHCVGERDVAELLREPAAAAAELEEACCALEDRVAVRPRKAA